MNERIFELAEQAGFQNGHQDRNGNSLSNELEKFAELIVRECAEQILAKGTDWIDFAPSQTGVRPEYWEMAQQIKQHFGVEE
jgi:hypothetical protein